MVEFESALTALATPQQQLACLPAPPCSISIVKQTTLETCESVLGMWIAGSVNGEL